MAGVNFIHAQSDCMYMVDKLYSVAYSGLVSLNTKGEMAQPGMSTCGRFLWLVREF